MKRAGLARSFRLAGATDQRFENWNERRALARPYFLRSTTRGSRVRKPPRLSTLRRSGSKWVSALEACPNAGFVFNAYRALDADGKERKIYREPLPPCSPGSVVLEEMFFKRWRFDSPVWGTVMARRSAYEKVGLFDERFGFCSDVDMWMRIAECFHVAYINEPLISLPSRETLPRKIAVEGRDLRRAAERMFWEARMRHYAGKPLQKGLALATHLIHVAGNRLFFLAINVRRRLLRRR